MIIDERGLTYAKAAEDIGISLTFLNQLMSGEKNPSVETLGDICAALETSRAKLFGEDEAQADPLPKWASALEKTIKNYHAELKTNIVLRTEHHISQARLEEIERLKAKINSLPASFWPFWQQKAGSRLKAAFLFLLLGDSKVLDGEDVPPRLLKSLRTLREDLLR